MNSEVKELKRSLRHKVYELLSQLSPEQKVEESMAVCSKILNSSLWQRAKSVLAFAPMESEINIWGLVLEGLKSGKTIALPFYVKERDEYEPRIIVDVEKDLVNGKMGIKEPGAQCRRVEIKELDLILVPGVAFSSDGYRLGRGKGYYDRLMEKANGTKCGVCFECQFGWTVPVERHDIRLNYIVTSSRWLEIGASSEVYK